MFIYEGATNVRQVLDNQNCQQIFITVKFLDLFLGLEHQRLARPCDLLIPSRAVSNERVAELPDSCTNLQQSRGWIIEGISKIMHFFAPGIMRPLQMHALHPKSRQFLARSQQVIRTIWIS
jgi:hypothetical protein